MNYDIFVSYSRKDLKVVMSFVSKLEESGYKVWIDQDGIESGDEFRANIVNAIRGCQIFIFFSSKSSNNSSWTLGEISVAREEKKKIIPIKLDDSPYNDAIRFDLSPLDFVNYEPDHKLAIEKVIHAINTYIGKGTNTIISSRENNKNIVDRIKVTSRSSIKKSKNELKKNLFKYAFCLVALLLIGYLSFTSKDSLGQLIDATNKELPSSYDELGIRLLKMSNEDDFVVFSYGVEENDSSIQSRQFNMEYLKDSFKENIKNSTDENKKKHELIVNANKNLKIQFIGEKSNIEYSFTLTNQELKDLLKK